MPCHDHYISKGYKREMGKSAPEPFTIDMPTEPVRGSKAYHLKLWEGFAVGASEPQTRTALRAHAEDR